MTEQSIEPPNFKRLKISRNLGLSKYKSSNYDDDLIFHPADETSNPTLLIEVLNNKELKGVIQGWCTLDVFFVTCGTYYGFFERTHQP